jgi:hypothetical protein
MRSDETPEDRGDWSFADPIPFPLAADTASVPVPDVVPESLTSAIPEAAPSAEPLAAAISEAVAASAEPVEAAAPESPAVIAEPLAAAAPEPVIQAPEVSQASLFMEDVPAAPAVSVPDESVTFGVPDREIPATAVDDSAFVGLPEEAPSDDLDAIVAGLDADIGGPVMPLAADDPSDADAATPDEAAEPSVPGDDATPVDMTPEDAAAAAAAAAAFAAAATSAHEDAVEAVLESGAPEGADNDADAVEALLEAEAEEPAVRAEMDEPILLAPPERKDRTLSVPFYVYLGVWFVFSVAMVLVLQAAAITGTLDRAPEYPMFVLGGLVLTVIGPVLTLFVFAISWWGKPKGERRGLFATAMLRGSLATFAGVAMWYVAIIVLNYLKTGRLY